MAYQILNITTQEPAEQRGLGVFLPFNGSHGLFTTTYTTRDQAVSNLKNLLLTVKGERILLPTFGTDLVRLLFEPNTDVIKQNVNDVITQPVNYWLPYINIVDITTKTWEDDANLDHTIDIKITFQIPSDLNDDDLSSITLTATNNQIVISDGN